MHIPRYAADIRSACADIPDDVREHVRSALRFLSVHLDKEACNNGNEPTADRYRTMAARFLTYFLALGPDGYEAVARFHRSK